MISRGQPWGHLREGPPDLTVIGGDDDLARAVADHPGALVRFEPRDSDLARCLGSPRGSDGTEVSLDAMRVRADGGEDRVAVNAVVVGTAPDHTTMWTRPRRLTVALDGEQWFDGLATAVVVANGQFLRTRDLAPRAHPGDGRLEVQVYRVPRGQRRTMRRRLATGTHLPHPEIRSRSGRRLRVVSPRPLAVELDGERDLAARDLSIELRPAAYRLAL